MTSSQVKINSTTIYVLVKKYYHNQIVIREQLYWSTKLILLIKLSIHQDIIMIFCMILSLQQTYSFKMIDILSSLKDWWFEDQALVQLGSLKLDLLTFINLILQFN